MIIYKGKLAVISQDKIQSNLSLGVTRGKDKKWLLKTGGPLIQVHLHYILVQGPSKGGCLRQVLP